MPRGLTSTSTAESATATIAATGDTPAVTSGAMSGTAVAMTAIDEAKKDVKPAMKQTTSRESSR